MKIQNMDIEKIIPYENNPRFNNEAIDKVASSIEKFGFNQPLVLDKDNIIVVGHTRYQASLKLGLKKIPVMIADKLSKDKIKAYRLADNKTGQISTWDMEKLAIELDNIKLDMNDFGFNIDDIEYDNIDQNFDINTEQQEQQEKKQEQQKYTSKIDLPEFVPQAESKPDLSKLLDDSKTIELIQEINNSNVDSEIKKFLIMSAYRHLKFNYEQIAEFYCKSPKEVQNLFERSILVIIDYDKAIIEGFADLSNNVSNQFLEENKEYKQDEE